MTETTDKEKLKRLNNATKKIQDEETQRREKTVKGSHLLQPMLEIANKQGLKVEERTGFHKITGAVKNIVVYLAKKGGRVDLSGFDIDAEGVTKISKEEAQAKHIGKVRGQLNFELPDETVLAAFTAAVAFVAAAKPEEKKPKVAKTKKTPAKVDTKATTDDTSPTTEGDDTTEQPAA